MVRLSTNFSLQEFTKSQTATRQGLDNTPNDEHLASATALFENVVQTNIQAVLFVEVLPQIKII
jgi:hypothetical protein